MYLYIYIDRGLEWLCRCISRCGEPRGGISVWCRHILVDAYNIMCIAHFYPWVSLRHSDCTQPHTLCIALCNAYVGKIYPQNIVADWLYSYFSFVRFFSVIVYTCFIVAYLYLISNYMVHIHTHTCIHIYEIKVNQF